MTHIAIIGAGLSGLTAANSLKDYADITIFEKSRGVSGRMSTRRAAPYFFDHGAQFFKARTDEFKAFIAPMIENGIIESWNARFVEFENKEIIKRRLWDKDYPHYVGVPGMNAIAKYLSQGLQITLGTRVQSLSRKHDKWFLKDDQGNGLGNYDWVISAIPAEQASALLPASLPFYAKMNAVTMTGCFSLMAGFENPLPLDFDAALLSDEDISWISVNSSKPGRNDSYSLLIHSTNPWADKHFNDDRDQVMNYLCRQTSSVIGHDVSKADYKAIHGWRYANLEKQTGDAHFIDLDMNVAVCGDWMIQGRVEAAFTSGYTLASKIIDTFS